MLHMALEKCVKQIGVLCLVFTKLDHVRSTDKVKVFELPRGKTNNVVSDKVRHKRSCTVTEAGWKLEISDLKRRGSVPSV